MQKLVDIPRLRTLFEEFGIHVILRKPYVAKTLLATLCDAIHPVG